MIAARAWGFVLALVGVTILADYFLKLASERDAWLASREFGIGAALYAASALGWVLAMQQMRLAEIAVAYSVLTLILLAALGAIVFRESLGLRDGAALACAAAALVLVGWPR